jgi:hypothetical protein
MPANNYSKALTTLRGQIAFPGFVDAKRHLCEIRNLYWHLRAIRPGQEAKRRKLYRRIAKQKAALEASGLDKEALRLWCRQWSRCYQEAARYRLCQYLQKNDAISKIFFEA